MRRASHVPGVVGADQRAIRRHNLGLVLGLVADRGPRSRATLAVETGLNKSTISSLIGELIDRGLLHEASSVEHPGAVGRPARPLELVREGPAVLGLEVNELSLSVLAVDLAGGVRYRNIVRADNRASEPERVLGRLAALTHDAVEALDVQRLVPVASTVALPGLVSVDGTLLQRAPNLGWEEVPVGEILAGQLALDRLELGVRVDNDANLAALGELWEGIGRSVRDFVFVYGATDGSGVGGAVVVDGALLRGAAGFGGELGHVSIRVDGARCQCGNVGCLELYCGERELLEAAGLEPPEDTESLAERARAGEPSVLRALEDAGTALGHASVSFANLLNPRAVVLGGTLQPLAEWLAPNVERHLREHYLAARWSACSVVAGALGRHGALRGAAVSALRQVLADPASVELRHVHSR